MAIIRKVPTSLLCWILVTWIVAPGQAAPRTFQSSPTSSLDAVDDASCAVSLVESIPEGLKFAAKEPKYESTHNAWQKLLSSAVKHISIASFYWSLLAEKKYSLSATDPGKNFYETLKEKTPSLKVNIAQNGEAKPDAELDGLIKAGAHVYWLDFKKLIGQGVLHTKLITVDGQHAYVGSANMDWRSLTEVKEVGAVMYGCNQLVSDIDKIHAAYMLASGGIPSNWPKELETVYNRTNPMKMRINGMTSQVYFSSSPPMLNPPGRNDDLDAVLSIINSARKFVYISVMNYIPEIRHYDGSQGLFWPEIDNALRTAALDRHVEVRLLLGNWSHNIKEMAIYTKSLQVLSGTHGAKISIRNFTVPTYTKEQMSIPYSRVNHDKFMVTETTAYIGTSNWSGDYFLYTGGIGFVIEQEEGDANEAKTIRRQLQELFERDWNSEYSGSEGEPGSGHMGLTCLPWLIFGGLTLTLTSEYGPLN
ncbi:unnamed protein product [Calicophoron daubneyi]|uniref:PLD phosphodiesterase domain-containing protein n=1 Tax=Calicophoron daubneyi TaxID=300641 RepID=A0AAV2TP27_CALDB